VGFTTCGSVIARYIVLTNSTVSWVGISAGLDYILDSPKLEKNASFSTEQKLNTLTHSVALLKLLLADSSIFPGVSRGQRSHAFLICFTFDGYG